MHINVLNQE